MLSDKPGKNDMFNGGNDFVSKEMNLELMSVVMTIAYLAMRTRPDLLTCVSYLTTRIYHHDPVDIAKIKTLIGYIIHTKDKVLTLASDEIKIYGFSDASYQNHPDGASQMGWTTCLGYNTETGVITGLVGATSKKNKKVVHSSAESELMAQAELLKSITQLKYRLEELGFPEQREITMFQDNKSAIVMGEQGHGGKNSKHIHMKEFAVKEFCDAGIVNLEYLMTNAMVADILTKPLIAALLREMTMRILNEKLVYTEEEINSKKRPSTSEDKINPKKKKLNVQALMLN